MTLQQDCARHPLPRSKSRTTPSLARGAEAHGPRTAARAPEIKLQVNLPGGSRLGPGKIRLLELIDSEGSLVRGAEKMGISYRRAWLFVQHVNQAFDEAAIATPEGGHGGGPARLTEFGRQLVRKYRDMERAAEQASSATLSWLRNHEG